MTFAGTRPARLQGEGEPASGLYRTLHRVADRLEPALREPFLRAVRAHREHVDLQRLETALRRGDTDAATLALDLDRMANAMRSDLGRAYRTTLQAAGEAVAEELSSELGASFSFDAVNPNAVLAARRDAGTLITRISRESRLAVRAVIADMHVSGVPPDRAARRVRQVVGLRQDHARAVSNFRDLLRRARDAPDDQLAGIARRATDRRLDAATKARVRRAIREREVTGALIDEVSEVYRGSLLNRRALDISRTESLRAAHAGQQETWRQAVQRGTLSRERTRRVAVVTPDDRLRETHAAVPDMNPEGVGLEEPFQTPMGPMMYPPWEPLCRCSVGLTFVGRAGVL